MKVRTDAEIAASVYNGVFEAFSTAMPLRRDPPFTGDLEITFSTAGHDWLTGASGGEVYRAKASDWYVGDRATEPTAPGTRGIEWQTSRMHAVLGRADGSPSWSADYIYNGGLELSGWTVKTPAQAAGLIARRLAARFSARKDVHGRV